jgi:HEAT repeat protein
MGFLGFGRPNVELLAARGDIEGLVSAAKYKKDPALAEQARLALEDMMGFLVANLGSRNLRHLVLSREALKMIGQPAVDLLSDVIAKGDAGRRCDAAVALGEIGLPTAIPALKKTLRDQDTMVRVCSVKALAQIGGPEANELVGKALRDPEDAVRHHARKAFKKLGREQGASA